MRKDIFCLVVILLLSIYGMGALFSPGLFSAHDIWHQVARFYHYKEAFNQGVFPPYWISTLASGFGYPLFFFSFHLPWIVGIPVSFLLDIQTTIKVLFFLSYLASGVFMYSFARDLLGSRLSALLAAIVYLFAPYRFLTILVSGAMGEAFVFVFIPLFLWGTTKIHRACQGDPLPCKGSPCTLCAIGTGGLILSHLPTAITLLPLLLSFVVYFLVSLKPKPRMSFLKNLCLSLLLGIGLSAFYLLPFIFYSGLTQVGSGAYSYIYENGFVSLSQLFYTKWGYGLNKVSALEGNVPYRIGFAEWLAFFVFASATILAFVRKRLDIKNYLLLFFLLSAFGFSLIAMLPISKPVWDIAERFVSVDNPTKFLITITFVGAVLSGLFLQRFRGKARRVVFLIFLVVALYTGRNHLRVNQYTHLPTSLYVESETTTSSYQEFLPKWADNNVLNDPGLAWGEGVNVASWVQKENGVSFELNSPKEQDISLRHFAFPGIKLYINGAARDYGIDEEGRIKANFPAGFHNVQFTFEETRVITIGKAVSIVSILMIATIAISTLKHKQRNKN